MSETEIVNYIVTKLSENCTAVHIGMTNKELLRKILVQLDNNPNITRISIFKELKTDNSFSNFISSTTTKYGSYSKTDRCSMLLDFEGNSYFMGKTDKTYMRSIQDNKYFRRNVCRLVFLNYDGQPIRCGYWIVNNLEDKRVQILDVNKWGQFIQSIPPPSEKISLHNSEISNKNRNDIKDFFFQFVTNLFEVNNFSGEIFNDFLNFIDSSECISKIIVGFTHKTIHPVINYEQHEYRGDRILISLFSEAMVAKFERITPTEASPFALEYISSTHQSKYSDDLHLFDRMIKHHVVSDSLKMKTDIFESLLGILTDLLHTFDMENETCLKFPVLYSFVVMIIDSTPFDRSIILGQNSQQVYQILETNGFQRGDIVVNTFDASATVTCSDNIIDYFMNIQKPSSDVKLISISSIHKTFDPYKETRASVVDKIWGEILDILKDNDIELLSKSRTMDNFIKLLKDHDRERYNKFVKKLLKLEDMPEDSNEAEINSVLSRVRFESKKQETYVMMWLNATEAQANSCIKTGVTCPIQADKIREEETYNDLNYNLHGTLAVVLFDSSINEIKKSKIPNLTPYNISKYQCIMQFISS